MASGYEPQYNPVHQGFDEFYGYVSGNVDFHSHYDNAGIYDWWHKEDSIYEEGYVTDLITDHTIDFIKAHKNRPFFAYVPHEAPHVPFQGREDTAYRYPGREFTYFGPVEDRDRAYREMIEVMDEGVGKILATVEAEGIAENTLIIFCSDNGAIPEYGENGLLNGHKTTLWEGGHRVPGMVYWKGEIEPGVSDQIMMSMDLFPTIAMLAGVKMNAKLELDGMDLSNAWLENNLIPSRPVFWRYRGNGAVRQDEWKLLLMESDTMLFDLGKDLGEQQDISEDFPDKYQELLDKYIEWEEEILEGVEMKTA